MSGKNGMRVHIGCNNCIALLVGEVCFWIEGERVMEGVLEYKLS